MTSLVQATERDGLSVLGGNVRLRRLFATPLFEVVLWRCVEDGDGLRAERCHESPVVTLVLAGASRMHERGRSLTIEPGATVFAPPFTPYRSSHPFGCGDLGCHLRLSPALLHELRLPEAGWLVRAASPRKVLRFRRALEAAAARCGDGLEVEEAGLALLGDALVAPRGRPAEGAVEGRGSSRARRRHAELAEEAKQLLLERFRDPLRLEAVAQALDASPFHLARVFRRATGLSLHAYRTRLRLWHAVERLRQGGVSLTELALDLGFASHSHFTDVFRAAFGLPPSAVRRSLAHQPRPGPP